MTLDELVAQLRQVHGGRLRSVVLYGSAAVGHHLPNQSDFNVLVLVDGVDPAQLEAFGPTARAWSEAGNAPPLELTLVEWRRSADIFPMEYADILERHRVLFGDPLPSDVGVNRGDLRRQTEYEAMGKVLRLRQGIMHAGTDTVRQLDLLRASHGTLMVIFRSALRTAGQEPPADKAALIAATAALAGFDAEPFSRVLTFVRGTGELSVSEAERVLFGTLRGMEALVEWLDALQLE